MLYENNFDFNCPNCGSKNTVPKRDEIKEKPLYE
jgi:hypothetical protein